jgi:hypothetical protein
VQNEGAWKITTKGAIDAFPHPLIREDDGYVHIERVAIICAGHLHRAFNFISEHQDLDVLILDVRGLEAAEEEGGGVTFSPLPAIEVQSRLRTV